MYAPETIAFPYVDNEGRPLRTRQENTQALLDAHRATVRYNAMTHGLELRFGGLEVNAARVNGTSLAWLRTLARRHGLSANNVCEDLPTCADEYHPALEWIDDAAWDGVDRIETLIDTVDTADTMAPELIRSWLLQCAAALVQDKGFRPEGVLTFQGPQGCGKTQWVRSLGSATAPEGIILIGRSIDPSNRDSIQQATSSWICEIGEVDGTFRKSDIAALKAFLDLDYDIYRAAYAREAERRPRRTSFFASVNRPDFLADTTGNRRWWSVNVQSCNWKHSIDTRQLWAQCVHLVRAGVRWRLTEDQHDALKDSNKRFEVLSPIAEELWSRWTAAADGRVRLGEICDAMGYAPGTSSYNRIAREVAQLLVTAGVSKTRIRTADGKRPTVFGLRRCSPD